MSSTVLRVKRRLEDNPQDAMVLVCKRLKTEVDNGEAEVSPTLFVFCGTVDNQETKHLPQTVYPKTDAKSKLGSNVNDIIKKIRKERKDVSTENRYELVNCSRGLQEDSNDKQKDVFDLIDLEQKQLDLEENTQYAYDLYRLAKPDFDISMLDNLVSIENYETELVFGSYRDNGRRTPSSDENESEDSNDENNWRNEYPDSEPSSIDEDDLVQAVQRVGLEYELSTDEEDNMAGNYPPTLYNDEVMRFGEAYANYKARVLAEENDENDPRKTKSRRIMDEDTYAGYKYDSDEGFYYGQDDDKAYDMAQGADDDSDLYDPD